ncbi:MAG: M4 family metallopeptidase [Flavobacteriaceae bacterium]|jgi:Zn-dependent metalloprotease|nr:M4 family metallopeptidase [Flavobacteriaceae bacterium]
MKKIFTLLLASAYFCGFAQESPELAKLKSETGARVTISKSTQNPNFIRFENPNALNLNSANAKAKADEFLSANFKAFNLKSASDVVFMEERTDNYGFKNEIYMQYYNGIPVFDGVLKFHFNAQEQLTSVNGNVISNIKTSSVPEISQTQAAAIAQSLIAQQGLNHSGIPLEIKKNNLLIFPKGLAQGDIAMPYLAYHIEITNQNDVREFLFINAHTGELVEQFTGIHPIDRRLYEVNTSPSNLVWQEGDAFPGSLDIWQQNEVVVAEQVYNFFKNAFNYTSYDNADHRMTTINNEPNINCPNANWNGSTTNYCTGVAADDVVAHEWGHAYTEYTSNLIYAFQPGALNESYSDVWGETIDLINNYQDEGENLAIRTTTDCEGTRWKQSEDATAFGGAIRDMWNPPCEGDPGRVGLGYYCGTGDGGGVHFNSGIPNHLYALLVDGGTYNGYTMTGMGFVKAAHLWWRATSVYLTATSDFSSFADALEAACNDLIGVNLEGLSTTATPFGLSGQILTSADLTNLQNGLLAVELRTEPTQCNFTPLLEPTPPLCEAATVSPVFVETWENGLGNWVVSNVPTNPSSWEERNWEVKGNLPKGRQGNAIFAPDPINGDCITSLQNGILRLESPLITIPAFASGNYEMAFNHYVATERTWDGGNIKYSLNGGAWTLVPFTAFTENDYNTILTFPALGNDNPMAGQRAFSGTDGGSLSGSWGQSVINLSAIGVTPGSNIKFRFEFGTDGCNGIEGWYVDEIYVYNCALLAVEDIQKNSSFQVFPNPTSGIVTIQNSKNLNLKTAELYNATGQLIRTFKLNGTSQNLDLSKIERGNYILKISSETETSSVKIIKK